MRASKRRPLRHGGKNNAGVMGITGYMGLGRRACVHIKYMPPISVLDKADREEVKGGYKGGSKY